MSCVHPLPSSEIRGVSPVTKEQKTIRESLLNETCELCGAGLKRRLHKAMLHWDLMCNHAVKTSSVRSKVRFPPQGF